MSNEKLVELEARIQIVEMTLIKIIREVFPETAKEIDEIIESLRGENGSDN